MSSFYGRCSFIDSVSRRSKAFNQSEFVLTPPPPSRPPPLTPTFPLHPCWIYALYTSYCVFFLPAFDSHVDFDVYLFFYPLLFTMLAQATFFFKKLLHPIIIVFPIMTKILMSTLIMYNPNNVSI